MDITIVRLTTSVAGAKRLIAELSLHGMHREALILARNLYVLRADYVDGVLKAVIARSANSIGYSGKVDLYERDMDVNVKINEFVKEKSKAKGEFIGAAVVPSIMLAAALVWGFFTRGLAALWDAVIYVPVSIMLCSWFYSSLNDGTTVPDIGYLDVAVIAPDR